MTIWTEEGGKLRRSFTFKDFSEAFAFMTRVALLAEKQGHHPELTIAYNTVHVACSTHDAGGAITERDRKLAGAIDKLRPG
jgi:4a-hydroxytetrahydrobiopterin dehydratase